VSRPHREPTALDRRSPRRAVAERGSVAMVKHRSSAYSLAAPRRIMPTRPTKNLESFPNPAPGRDYEIRFECPEFTCLCPRTGQPDFGTIRIRYTPNELCVELKSLKLYLWSFRDEGHFHEAVTNRILDDLVLLLAPRTMTVEGDFLIRGGIHTVVEARHP
jgi:7-cyano-7-deazaguanine reductase